MIKVQKHWQGELPSKCDVCGGSLTQGFVDGRTVYGPWAIMCPRCHFEVGQGVGLGKGQQYSAEGVKVAG